MKAPKSKIDPRITPTPKTTPPLPVPYVTNAQKSQSGGNYFIGLLQKKPNYGQFPQTKGGPPKSKKPRQNF